MAVAAEVAVLPASGFASLLNTGEIGRSVQNGFHMQCVCWLASTHFQFWQSFGKIMR
jgi:hypothetical protein